MWITRLLIHNARFRFFHAQRQGREGVRYEVKPQKLDRQQWDRPPQNHREEYDKDFRQVTRHQEEHELADVGEDDPPFFHTTMTREWDRLAEAFDWDQGVFDSLNRTALEAAFCDAATKDKIAKRLETRA